MAKDEAEGSKKHGEPTKYDPSFNGPIKNRGCTDVICCLIFCICFLGMLAVAALAFARGDPIKLLYPTDSDGNLCGTGNYADKPNLFFFDLTVCAQMGIGVIATGCPTPQVCIEKCPDTNFYYRTSIESDTVIRNKLICKPNIKAQTSAKVCVEICPSTSFTWAQIKKDSASIDKMICRRSINPGTSSRSIQELVEDEDCAAYYITSEPIVGRCIPSIFVDALNRTLNLASSDGTEIRDKLNQTLTGTQLEDGTKYLAYFLSAKEYGVKIYQDVRAAWWMILIALGLSMLIAFIWIIIMRWIAGVMVWISIFAFLGLFGFATYYCISKYLTMQNEPSAQLAGSLQFTTNLDYYWNLAVTWLVFGCVAGGILLITLILLIFLRNRIRTAISLIKESSRAVGSMIFTLFFPLFPFLLEIILFGFWGASAVYLASMGTSDYGAFNKTQVNETVNVTENGNTVTVTRVKEVILDITGQIDCSLITGNSTASTNLQSFCNFVKYGGDEYTIYLQFYQLFMLLWCMNFIVAYGQMTLAGAFASYYWAFNKPKDIPMFPLAASTWRSLRYHLGTIAFGSLIIALIQLIRIALEYLDHKLKGSENQVAKFFLKCLKCCFWCLEKFMKFLNKNAYIMCAIYGKNFCVSAKNAFMLIIRNIVRVAVIDKVTDFVLLLSKLFVVGAIGVIAFLFFSGEATTLAMQVSATAGNTLATYTPALNYYLTPVIIILKNLTSSALTCKGRYILSFLLGPSIKYIRSGLSLLFFSGDLSKYIPVQAVSDYIQNFVPSLNNYMIPVAIICLGSYIIAAAFFSVYGMAVDTLFLCFLEDLERNDGSEEKPYYMSKDLMGILGKKNKVEKKE